jgi:hypothetical protein
MPLNLWRRRRRRRRQLLLLMHYYLCSNFYYILGIILLILREEERIRKLSKLTNKPDRNKRYTRQRLEAMDADEADKLYRFTHFTREQLFWLAPVLLDETNWTESRDKFDCVEGLVIVTRRLRNYCDWNELVRILGRSAGSLSRIYVHCLQVIDRRFSHLLQFQPQRWRHLLPYWRRCILEKQSWCPPAWNIAVFLDGTMRQLCFITCGSACVVKT